MSVACATFHARTSRAKRAPTVELCESDEQYVPLNDGFNWKGDPNATLSGQGVPQYPPGADPRLSLPVGAGPRHPRRRRRRPLRRSPSFPTTRPPATTWAQMASIYTESDLAESTKGKTWQDMLIPPSR